MIKRGDVKSRLIEPHAHVSLGDERRRPVFVVLHFDAVRHVLDQKRLLEHGVDQGLLQGVLGRGEGRDEGSGKEAESVRGSEQRRHSSLHVCAAAW